MTNERHYQDSDDAALTRAQGSGYPRERTPKSSMSESSEQPQPRDGEQTRAEAKKPAQPEPARREVQPAAQPKEQLQEPKAKKEEPEDPNKGKAHKPAGDSPDRQPEILTAKPVEKDSIAANFRKLFSVTPDQIKDDKLRGKAEEFTILVSRQILPRLDTNGLAAVYLDWEPDPLKGPLSHEENVLSFRAKHLILAVAEQKGVTTEQFQEGIDKAMKRKIEKDQVAGDLKELKSLVNGHADEEAPVSGPHLEITPESAAQPAPGKEKVKAKDRLDSVNQRYMALAAQKGEEYLEELGIEILREANYVPPLPPEEDERRENIHQTAKEQQEAHPAEARARQGRRRRGSQQETAVALKEAIGSLGGTTIDRDPITDFTEADFDDLLEAEAASINSALSRINRDLRAIPENQRDQKIIEVAELNSSAVLGIRDQLASANATELEFNREQLGRYARLMQTVPNLREEGEKLERELERARTADLGRKREIMTGVADKLRSHYQEQETRKESGREKIESLEELAEIIMASEVPKFRPDGEFALFKKNTETGEMEFQPYNFLAWARERMLYYHDLSPNSEINFEQDISIPLTYRTISLREILNTPQYFRKRSTVVMGVVDGQPVTKEEAQASESYDNLKDQLMHEQWLFNTSHNNDAGYRLQMGNMGELSKFIAQKYYFNVFTENRKRLLRMLKLPGVNMDSGLNKAAFAEIMARDAAQQATAGKVGRALRRSLVAYTYLPDKDMFAETLTPEGMDAFYRAVIEGSFKQELDEHNKEIEQENERRRAADPHAEDTPLLSANFLRPLPPDTQANHEARTRILAERARAKQELQQRIGFSDAEWEMMLTGRGGGLEKLARKALTYRFGILEIPYSDDIPEEKAQKEKGRVKGHTRAQWSNIKDEIKDNDPHKDEQLKIMSFRSFNFFKGNKEDPDLVAVTRAAIQAGVAKAEGLDINNDKRDMLDMKYAEALSNTMTSWTGIAAANDTNAIGFDKWNNLLATKEYRIRQAEGRGPSGLRETFDGIERLGLNFWQGLKVKKEGEVDYSRTLIEMLQGGEGGTINLDTQIDDFDFQTNAMRQYFVEHFSNGVKMLSNLEKYGTDVPKLIHRDQVSGVISIDLDKMDEVIRDGLWHDIRYLYDQPSILWGKKLRTWYKEQEGDSRELKFATRRIEDTMLSKEVQNMGMYAPGQQEDKMGRNVLAYLIQKELEYRRKSGTGQPRWGYEEIEHFKHYFTHWWPLKLKEVTKPDGTHEYQVAQFFFSDHEWEHNIAAPVNVTDRQLKWEINRRDFIAGGGEVLLGMFQELLKRLGVKL